MLKLKLKLKKILVVALISVQILSCFSIISYGIDRNAKNKYGTLQQELSESIQNHNQLNTPLKPLKETELCVLNYIQLIVYFIVVLLATEKIVEKGDELF